MVDSVGLSETIINNNYDYICEIFIHSSESILLSATMTNATMTNFPVDMVVTSSGVVFRDFVNLASTMAAKRCALNYHSTV